MQHLKLEGIARNLLSHSKCLGFVDDVLIMRGEAMIDAALQEHFHELDIVGVDLGLLLKSNLGRLFVRAFAQADADSIRKQLLDVGFGAQHVRLDNRTHMTTVAGHAMKRVHELESALRVG